MNKTTKILSTLALAAGMTAASVGTASTIHAQQPETTVSIDDLYSYPIDSYLVSAEALNVRTKASASSHKADTLHLGDSLKLISFANADWAKVHYNNGKTGFVSTHYIVKAATTVKTKTKTKVYTSAEGKSIKTLPANTSVSFLGWSKTKKGGFDFDWVFVDYGGATGYMKTKDLHMTK
ncbi:SH3 domain-containing protein [Bacillus inaquosorum]|uniref:SH3 domain-containing protein n=1 Tax=Bacillus inaquosorum TaxID=483913 RepID=UPI00227D9BCA|nr:SH3 domain-containing protein [Bacillus inaquosorum]MCY9084660.1 SH3 domain-containing protein [Bacillus inaquosorum]MCY9178687.1 SH3 domain-containing protein [Bacillus inaquosorum]MCY9298280.1 SH3 domain-containing protein [Bacillus inaquosorum]MEC0546878.1 SH3 domain-containing protein [Bacillus inaquosorum]